ncbi:unnamed protein product, partial [Staurois parvus]
SSRRVPVPLRSSGRTARGEEFVTLPRLHPDSQCLPRSAGRIKRSAGPYCRVLNFGAAAREEGGERAPGTQKSRIKECKEPQLADHCTRAHPSQRGQFS